ncbi:hypothetical protein [Bradyrhizobium sp. 141]|uniref:hypothetical protein n=1 Tax=Bradyrhizobium sp. 141 TaxID=2782617 RepID=UPI001FF8BF96|nr:hypothetical protein [Bradyrhizobium sp. 141]
MHYFKLKFRDLIEELPDPQPFTLRTVPAGDRSWRRSRQWRSLIASWLIGLCLGLALRHTSIELLKGLKDLPSLLSDGPVSHLPVDELLSEDIEVRLAACDALHARRPLGPAGVKDGQVLFDEFKSGSAARLPGKYLQYGQLKAHMRTQRFNESPTIPALPKAG